MTHLDEYANKYRHVAFDRRDGVLEVRLHTDDGPMVWSPSAHRELADAYGDIAGDPETKVVILTGTGDSFIGSMDTSAFMAAGLSWDVGICSRTFDKFGPKDMVDKLPAVRQAIETARAKILSGEIHVTNAELEPYK